MPNSTRSPSWHIASRTLVYIHPFFLMMPFIRQGCSGNNSQHHAASRSIPQSTSSTGAGVGSDASPSSKYRLEVDNTASDVSLSVGDSLSEHQGDSSTESDAVDSDHKQHPKGPVPTLSPDEWAKATAVSGPADDDGHLDVFAHKLHDVLSLGHDDAPDAGQVDQDKVASSDSSAADELSLKPQASAPSADALGEFLRKF